MKNIKIALVDVVGLVYDGDTMKKHGLGGSESAVTMQAKELVKLGFDVTVYNNCRGNKDTDEGVFDGVRYVDLIRLHEPNDFTCDVMMVSRTILPFVPEKYWSSFNYPAKVFQQLKNSAKLKVLILHDTFCSGDHLLEEVVLDGHIDQIFTLSDFHTSYIANCNHGRRRNFEVLKNKFFQTRNGANQYFEADLTKKDRNHFVYNASITKGMLPLVHDIWPRVKRAIPDAKLTVIGGFYRFREGTPPDAQEVEWHKLVARPEMRNMDITFTGVIPQRQIADILASALFMIYPGAFPETFGISTLEALLYNTVPITTRFGALEETAIDLASYKIDYAIEPNSLFTDINKEQQITKFVDAVIRAYNTPYLTQQKMYACNQVKSIAGWDTVMLQWKQQLYKSLGLYLPVDEYRRVQRINAEVAKVFGRRFTNPVERSWPKTKTEYPITVITPVYNAERYIRNCILSVAAQDYQNYKHIIIDDASTDNTEQVIRNTINELPESLQEKFIWYTNSHNVGSVGNYVSQFIHRDGEQSIYMMLDGDDALVNDPSIFDYYSDLYHNGAEFTYGSMWSLADNIPLIAQPYPKHIRDTKAYREYLFPWNLPYTHLRTFSSDLIPPNYHMLKQAMKDETGAYYRAGGDVAMFYYFIERAHPDKIVAVPHVMVLYNDVNPINDYKVNAAEQTATAKAIIMKGNRRV